MAGETPLARRVGYCTNVHAGATLDEAKRQLDIHATAVQRVVAPRGSLNIGLWLSAVAARELARADDVARFRDWLAERRLCVFTINGFPHGDFHGPIVKHAVYEPSWADPARARYTLDLARILAGLIDEREEAGISTLPVGWPGPPCAAVDRTIAVRHMRKAARALHQLASETGRLIHLDLEPEPGCILSTSGDVVEFFHVLQQDAAAHEADVIRRHIRVCHDICHAAVMFEDQDDVFTRYDGAGISIGKVQVSNAIAIGSPSQKALAALQSFAEDRYLHQTTIRRGGDIEFFEDLGPALTGLAGHGAPNADELRVHYHVPIMAEHLGVLGSTHREIVRCLDLIARRSDARDLEVETYTWSVLPTDHRPANLAEGIGHEMQWLHDQMIEQGLPVEAD